jgi:hypothetical protein
MTWVGRTFAVAGAALLVAACSSDGPTARVVAWKDYEPGLQAKIDGWATAKDCQHLTLEFNQIGGTNLAVRTKFGHGNEEILDYIDGQQHAAGCFDPASTTP